MKNVLVIQLFRRDAVLQSTPALAALRKARPDARIHVLARKPFGDALHGNPDADEVIEWDMEARTPSADEPDSPPTARRLSELRESLRPLREKRFDAVYNLSNDAMGALVACLLKPRESSGLVLCRDRNYRFRDDMSAASGGDWLRCVYVSGGVESPKLFNLADAFARACGCAEAPSPPRVAMSPADERYAEEVIGHCSPDGATGMIVLQPGASGGPAGQGGADEGDARRCAPCWVALAGRLRRAGHDLLFLGGAEGAAEDGARVTEEGCCCAPEPASVGQLVALLRRCRLLVSADAATAQAAAAAGTPCLFLASRSFQERDAWESGPSGEGHFILEPKTRRPFKLGQPSGDLPCCDLPDPDAVLGAVECALSDGRDVPESLQAACGNPRTLGARAVLHRSARMPDGLLGLRPLGRPALTLNDLLRLMLRTCLLRQRFGLRFAPAERSGGSWRPWLDEVFAWYSLGDRECLVGRAEQAAESFAMLRWIAQLGVQTAPAPDPGADRGSAMQPSQGWIERRILALEENETLRLLIALFRRSMLDIEILPLRQKAVARRWNCRLLAEECGFMAQSLLDFARRAGLVEQDRASEKTRNRRSRPVCPTIRSW